MHQSDLTAVTHPAAVTRSASATVALTDIAIAERPFLAAAGLAHRSRGLLGKLCDTIAGAVKVNNSRRVRQIIADARRLVESEILLNNHIGRDLADMETVHTYQATDAVQTPLVRPATTRHAGCTSAPHISRRQSFAKPRSTDR